MTAVEPLLPRRQSLFPDASTVVSSDAGHFVPENAGADLVRPVEPFLQAV